MTRRPIYCDCCGTEVCAQHDGNRIVIRQRKHGRDHYAIVDVDKNRKSEDNSRKSTTATVEG